MPGSSIPTSNPPEDAEEPPSRPQPAADRPLQVAILLDEGVRSPLEFSALRSAVRAAARERGCRSGEIGLRLTDDQAIQEINRRHLEHDYATDVISFGYEYQPPMIEGELVVSVETAEREAAACREAAKETETAEPGESLADWGAAEELLLYVVHGVLHIAGMDDRAPDDRLQMRRAEQRVMTELGAAQIRRFGADSTVGAEAAEDRSGAERAT